MMMMMLRRVYKESYVRKRDYNYAIRSVTDHDALYDIIY